MNIASFAISILSALISLATFARTAWRDHVREVHYQANAVSTWMTGTHVDDPTLCDRKPMEEVILCNRSDQPVYDVVLSTGVQESNSPFRQHINSKVTDLAAIACTVVGVLPPGVFRSVVIAPSLGMSKRFQSIISFRDTAGNAWIRDANGKLHSLSNNTSTFEAMGCPLPPPYVVPITAVTL